MRYNKAHFQVDEFYCPHCGIYAHQTWEQYTIDERIWKKSRTRKVYYAICNHCKECSIWLPYDATRANPPTGFMIYPYSSATPMPKEDMPADVKADYLEARDIAGKSPRGAAALLRLALQKLMTALGERGENINEDIKSLVQKGLSPDVQKALDFVRVIGNNAVHPGQIDLKDDIDTVNALFSLLNYIVESCITHPKKLDELYSSLPQSTLDAINKRDGKPNP